SSAACTALADARTRTDPSRPLIDHLPTMPPFLAACCAAAVDNAHNGTPIRAPCGPCKRQACSCDHYVEMPFPNQSPRSGFPNTDGMRSCKNKSSCALTPMERPASLLSGTIASAATCQLTATYDRPGFIVAAVFCPRGESNENSTRGTNWFKGSSFGSLPGVNRLVR